MTPLPFLTRQRELLRGDGRFEPLGGGGASWRAPLVFLARELCAFNWFDAGRASGSAARAAARLQARSAAPFANAGGLIRRGPGGFGIWSWDRDWLAPRLADRFGTRAVTVAPEPLGQPAGGGWRIVRGSSGYEAQCWIAGALVVSTWRREPFDEASWRSFARVQRTASIEPPAQPPAALVLPLSVDPVLWDGLADFDAEQMARVAAVLVAAALAGAAGLFCGQALRLRSLASATESEGRALAQAAPPADVVEAGASQRLAAFRQLSARPNMVGALSVALGVLQLYGVRPKGFAIDGSVVTLTLPYTTINQVDRIVQSLQNSGAFSDARPLTDAAAQEIRLRLVASGRFQMLNQPG